jgi:two-component system, NtrC family, sensor histidine kinase HydH
MNSLRARIVVLWALVAGVCAMLVCVLWMANRSGPQARIHAAERATSRACESLQQAHRRLVPVSGAPDLTLLAVVTDLSLRDAIGIEGGIWDPQAGFVAYAFPTHEAAARKTDMPEAERPAIEALVERVSPAEPALSDLQRGSREVGVFAACALPSGEVAWTFTRVAAAEAHELQRVGAIAAGALALVVLAGFWLLSGLLRWGRRLTALESALARRDDPERPIPATGERDLDRLALAINTSASQVAVLNEEARSLEARLRSAERLGAVGRLAAGMAHEIRNPLGSMRLRAENALATSGEHALERRDAALTSVLKAVGRLEKLVDSLLALTRPIRPVPVQTPLVAWMNEAVASRSDEAENRGVSLSGEGDSSLNAAFDPAALGRALDNLLQNALAHCPRGGAVKVAISSDAQHWRVHVSDTGPGVSEALRAHLFEPFATGRADGTGLGLAIAREVVESHGGRLTLVDSPPGEGAHFEMEMPWRAS